MHGKVRGRAVHAESMQCHARCSLHELLKQGAAGMFQLAVCHVCHKVRSGSGCCMRQVQSTVRSRQVVRSSKLFG